MKCFFAIILFSVLTSLWLVLFFGSAHAYIDPGSGSYVFQILIAGLLGAVFATKAFWKNVRMFLATRLGKKRSNKNDDQ
ncbi:MAG: hypothetical protein ABIK83_16020 [Candidatus Zixiibacteriota bacterium]